jgi:hypothetical protein
MQALMKKIFPEFFGALQFSYLRFAQRSGYSWAGALLVFRVVADNVRPG